MASLANLLRTALATSVQEAAAPILQLKIPEETIKLKKQISLVCDRLAKGFKLQKEPKKKDQKQK
jgi:hypothetical protein